eukprot:5670884-Amphidinium_carterae.2
MCDNAERRGLKRVCTCQALALIGLGGVGSIVQWLEEVDGSALAPPVPQSRVEEACQHSGYMQIGLSESSVRSPGTSMA